MHTNQAADRKRCSSWGLLWSFQPLFQHRYVAQGYSVTDNDDEIRCLLSRCTNGGTSPSSRDLVGTIPVGIPCPTDGSTTAMIDTAFLTKGCLQWEHRVLIGTAPMSVLSRDASALDSGANFFSKWNVGMIGGDHWGCLCHCQCFAAFVPIQVVHTWANFLQHKLSSETVQVE